MAALARWCVRRRLVVVLLWLLALGGVSAGAAVAGSAYSNDYEVPGTESGRATQLLQDGFPDLGGDSDTVVWHVTSGSVRAADVEQTMTTTLNKIADLPGVAAVVSPYDDTGAGRVSADGHTAYATVTFADAAEDIDASEAKAVVDTAKDAEADGLQVELGGSAIALTESSGGHTAEVVGVLVAALVLFLAFGSLAASLLPIGTALVGVGTAYAGIGLLGHAMTVADFAPMLGMLIGLGVGIDYALFVVTRHRRGLKRGLSVTESVVNAVTTTGRAVVFAGATVCIALLGMLILRLGFLNGVAIAASLTVVLTVAASVTLLPALLSLIGMRALSRRERRRLAEHGPEPELPTGFAHRWSAFVERHPKLLGAVALLVITVLALPTLGLRLGTSDQGNGPSSSTTRQAYDLLADGFGPGVNGPLTLVTPVDGAEDRLLLDNLDATLRTTEGIASTTPVTYDTGGDLAYFTVVPDSAPQSRQTSDLVDRLRTEVLPRAETGTSLDIHVGGMTASYDDFADVIVGKLPLFVGVVISLGCLLLLLAFRSVGIPLKAAAMNVAAVAAAFGVVVAIFQWGWGSELLGLGRAGPIEPFLPVIMVSVLFGLSMDYQVFLVSRMYEEWLETGDNRRAVRVGLAETSRVINSAAVIMISVFLAFVLSGDRVIAMFGIALAAAVALDAFVLRTLLVPALMHLLGGANWWLPGWLDRRMPRISIEPPECRAAHERLDEVVEELEKERDGDVRDIAG
ncbi:RND superfamily putative drug exporter [Streptomyces sp. SAI-135]|uniref:MMPL family transporter n=1 Tax=unclassified Streptomyces TaxID=2593676 RepID=UPI0024732AC1|nr:MULTISPECIES: MMPL family transporter [unclassified Streptomyces]MDH6516325.1 RND superfamily putative drug exporter [Streptomyces sp. SAI-090]MDH6587458.1 RND superfamily putative drug exporter [Streptomyces sp. SAI-133]MDH6619585.1 RND superfamily putative drug exporter [Streptomyces sp. SAI-135]